MAVINKQLLNILKNIVKEAGMMSLHLRDLGLEVFTKQDNSAVTNADKAISTFIYENLSKYTPDIPVICEERELVFIDRGTVFWLVDPIDGTSSYINNSDNFTINVALINNNIPEYGFIYQPISQKLYFTDELQQFHIEVKDELIKVDSNDRQDFVAIISSSNLNYDTKQYLSKYNFVKVISIPSSIKLCMVAENIGDVYPKFTQTMEWDIAAGHALIRSVGGEIFTLDGSVMGYAKKNFINPHFIAAGRKWRNFVSHIS